MATRTSIFATNDTLTADDLNSLAGAWNSYTPTLTGFTPGNGTASGEYLQLGKLVIFRAQFEFGSTSAAATNRPTLTLPVTRTSTSGYQLLQGWAYIGTSVFMLGAVMTSTTVVSLYDITSDNALGSCTVDTPDTWATGSRLHVAGVYQAA